MSQSIHGHRVMEMMTASGKLYTRTSLVDEIKIKFGSSARFHTCSAENMTSEELIDLLRGKGKLVGSDEGFSTIPENICHHE